MKITLIITTYNLPQSLELVIESVHKQTVMPSQIVIADDGSDIETKDLIDKIIEKSRINLIHSWHEDKGFRAAKSRNNALLKSTGEYIILIDGDMILHKNFIEDHIKMAMPGCFIQGSRVLLSKTLSEKVFEKKITTFSFFSLQIKNRKNLIHSNFLSKIFSRKTKNIRGIRSCNMSFYRKDCFNINGFNNDFVDLGREDTEFVVRLMNNGIIRKNIRFAAIQFHLWHNEVTRKGLSKNNELLEIAMKKNLTKCKDVIYSINYYES